MEKKDFIRKIADESGYTQKDIANVLDVMATVSFKGLCEGEEIPLIKGVKLVRKFYPERKGTNPQTGEPIMIPGRYGVRAKFAASIKDAVRASE